MDFKFDHKPICLFCEHGHELFETGMVMCDKNGAVSEDYTCSKFKYNLLARNPKRQKKLNVSKFSKEDFEF